MIAIIDYGMGNIYNVDKAFYYLGAKVKVTNNPLDINNAAKVVVPGVGAFGDCVRQLKEYDLIEPIKEAAGRGKPLLGICLGFQVFFEESEEDGGGEKGLGLFKGKVKKIAAPALKIPHMGWNSLELKKKSPLFKNLPDASYVYFVHSYHAVPEDESLITALTDYGGAVTAAVGKDNVQAVQFHPEKSGRLGLEILKNFKEL